MPPTSTADLAQATSTAAAKLERQRKRIEEADAALNVPLPVDRRHQKTKSRRQSDCQPDSSPDKPGIHGGVPVSERRINTFRAISRESSLARPTSVHSHRTSDTAASEMERHDSALTDGGFQLFTGRRGRKHLADLNPFEDRPDARHSTVEAAFDKREIYDVFGNALPGPEFMEENPGVKDGQLQFVQHPNGDVSAHQWSQARYMWENIGQFSNIRKKVEGQLAAERLKGQTAHQTLQQHTLAYFRTIAKQREATALGLPFGPKEIQAAMPHLSVSDVTAAPSTLKEPAKCQPQQASLHKPESHATMSQVPQLIYRVSEPSNYGQSFGQQPGRQEDPFYSASPYQPIYGPYAYNPQYYSLPTSYNLSASKTSGRGATFTGIATKPLGLNPDFHFPPAAPSNRMLQVPSHMPSAGYHPPPMFLADSQQPVYPVVYGSLGLQNLQHRGLNAYSTAETSEFNHGTASSGVAAPKRRPENSSGNRASMSDQLWKITETAKERNLSQTNISRTVLYDPYQNQNQSSTEAPSHVFGNDKKEWSIDFSRNAVSKNLQPSGSLDPTSNNYFPTVLAPKIRLPSSSPVRRYAENNLHESSPDTHWSKRPYDHSTPVMTAPRQNQATPQTFSAPFFPADSRRSSSGTTSSFPTSTNSKSYDEELNDWWTSGNKFIRQEEFFESIIVARKGTDSKMNSPPAHLNPIGPASRTPRSQPSKPAFNPVTTRLLIPVLENLALYVQGPVEKRRDYFSQWSKAPEWAIDRSEHGNHSFYDADWGQPPARVGRDPRYSGRGRASWSSDLKSAPLGARFVPPSYHHHTGMGSSGGSFMRNPAVGGGVERRLIFSGR